MEVTNKPHHQKRIKVHMQKDEVREDGGAELNWESPMQSRSWYEWVLVFRNKTDLGLISVLNAQGIAHL
jgi:hypothetical protein